MECIPQTLTAPSLGDDLEGERREPCLIQVKVVEGVFSGPQKRQIVEGLAETIVSIGGENIRQVTWGLVEASASTTRRTPKRSGRPPHATTSPSTESRRSASCRRMRTGEATTHSKEDAR
jgi:hypothetical protein